MGNAHMHLLIGRRVLITIRNVVGASEEIIRYFGKVTGAEGNLIGISNCKVLEKIVNGSTASTPRTEIETRWFNTHASGFLYIDEC